MLGKGYGEPVAMEGALKLKEMTYIHAEGYSGGALKHGPFALIEGNDVSVFHVTRTTTTVLLHTRVSWFWRFLAFDVFSVRLKQKRPNVRFT